MKPIAGIEGSIIMMAGTSPVGGSEIRRVLVIEDNTLVGMNLRALLEQLGHDVVGQAASAAEASRMFHDLKPDFLLLDIRLNDDDGLDLLRQLLKERAVPAVVVTAYGDQSLIARAGAAGVYGYLIKPVTVEALSAQIEIAARRFAETMQLQQENQTLAQTLEDRKLIEKAKGVFMRRLSLTEPEAHKRIQLESQKRRTSMAELAKKILESEDLFGAG